MFEVILSRRDSQDTYLIAVKHYDQEIWRRFRIHDIEIAVVVFDVLDEFLHELDKEGYLYQPKTEMLDERVEELKGMIKRLPPGFTNKQRMLELLEQL